MRDGAQTRKADEDLKGRMRDNVHSNAAPEVLRYFVTACVLMACLFVLSRLAPVLPMWALLPFLIAFAVLSTMGALYHTVIWRFHKQYKLVAGGTLSYYNRRWRVWFAGFMIASLVSAFLFMLESPKWDALEWALLCAAIPIYYVVFKASASFLSREYAPRFYKSRAMILSFWIVGIALCLLYAILTSVLPGPEYASLQAAFDATAKHYADSPSALMADLDRLTSFADGLTSFGMLELQGASYMLGLICRFVVYAAVFFSLVNQFGFCLLTPEEMKSEFQLLPVYDERSGTFERPEQGRSLDKVYLAVFAGVVIAASAILLGLEGAAEHARASEEQTAIEAFINEQTALAVHVLDGEYERMKSSEEVRAQMREELEPLVNDYYDGCRENVAEYVSWRKSPLGMLSNWAEPGRRKARFKDGITKDVSDAEIERVYGEYEDRLSVLDQAQARVSWLNLWSVLEASAYSQQVQELFANEDDLEAKVVSMIEAARQNTLSELSA